MIAGTVDTYARTKREEVIVTELMAELERTGLFWHDRRPRPTHYRLGAAPEVEADRQALWRYCLDALAAAGIPEAL
jgi:hypothetical protein